MTSGKRSKERRRQVQAPQPAGRGKAKRRQGRTPPPPVRGKGRTRRASPKLLIGVAAAVVVVAAVVGIAFAVTSGSSSPTPTALPGAGEVRRLLSGIPQSGNTLGSPSAPVTVVEYVDLQCPYCQQFETQALRTIVKRFVRTGKAKIEARPIAFIGPDSVRGQAGAIAAGDQNRMFNFMQMLYLNQGSENTGWLSSGTADSAAVSIPGVDLGQFRDAIGSSSVQDRAKQFSRQAAQDNVNSTPTILVGKSGKSLHVVALASPSDAGAVATAIQNALG